MTLTESTCLASMPGPYHFLSPDSSENSRPVQYIDDIYFIPTARLNGPVISYLRDTLHISYSRTNPFVFYICPDTGKDVSNVTATFRTAEFAKHNQDIAMTERLHLLTGTLLGQDSAILYIEAAFKDDSLYKRSITVRNELIELALMYNNNGANLESVVLDVANINAQNVRLLENGIQYDLSAATLFLTHSAFPSLFQSYNPSFGSHGTPLRTQDATDLESLNSTEVSYSSIKHIVPRATLLHDLGQFYEFETRKTTNRLNTAY